MKQKTSSCTPLTTSKLLLSSLFPNYRRFQLVTGVSGAIVQFILQSVHCHSTLFGQIFEDENRMFQLQQKREPFNVGTQLSNGVFRGICGWNMAVSCEGGAMTRGQDSRTFWHLTLRDGARARSHCRIWHSRVSLTNRQSALLLVTRLDTPIPQVAEHGDQSVVCGKHVDVIRPWDSERDSHSVEQAPGQL